MSEMALTPRQNLDMVMQQHGAEIAALMPKGMTPERLRQIYLTEIKGNPKLLACSPKSLLDCIIDSARIGMDPGGPLGYCFFVPYGSQAQFQLGYAGIAELIYRSGRTGPISVGAVFKGDAFFYEKGSEQRLSHKPCGNINENEITHFYSYCRVHGEFTFDVMTVDEVRKIMKVAIARLRNKDEGPWAEHFAEMGKKTVLKRHSKVLPKSAEAARAIHQDSVKEFGEEKLPEIDIGESDDEMKRWKEEALEVERAAREEAEGS